MLAILLTAEIAIVLVLDAVIVVQGGDHGLSNGIVNPSAIFSGSLGIGLLFALISYVGFEATAIFRDEARTPDRTIPRATYIALILIGVFYAVTSWALISGWGDEEAVSRATDSGSHLPGRHRAALHRRRRHRHHHGAVLHQPVRLHSVVPQRGVALRLRPVAARRAARVAEPPAHQARLAASGVAVDLRRSSRSASSLAVVFKLDPAAQFYTWFAGATTVGFVVLLIATSVAVLVYFARDRRGYSQWRVRIAPALGLVGLAGSTGADRGQPRRIWWAAPASWAG